MKTSLPIVLLLLLLRQICFTQGYWTKIGDMPEIRYGHTVHEINGKIYIVGGLNTETGIYPTTMLIYDSTTATWTQDSLPDNNMRAQHASCVVDGKIYLIGGWTLSGGSPVTVADLDMYDPNTGHWIAGNPMPTHRLNVECDTVDGKIYVIGGLQIIGGVPITTGVRTLEVYDIASEIWTSGPNMAVPRWGHKVVAYDGKIYVFGGNANVPQSSVEVYDTQTNSWSLQPNNMRTGRYQFTACRLDSLIYIIGGWRSSGQGPIYDIVETYDPDTDEWTLTDPWPVARALQAGFVRNGNIYIYGGARTTHPNIGTSGIYEYSTTDIFNLQPYVDKTYAGINSDSVLFRTRFHNIYQHPFTANLIYANLDSTQIDSLPLLDDGLHGDSLANDGLYGAYIPPRSWEDFFSLSVSTVDLLTTKYYRTPESCRFTTAGPVALDSLACNKIALPRTYQVIPFLKNHSTIFTMSILRLTLICNDPWIESIQPVYTDLPDLAPGQTERPAIPFTVRYIDTLFSGIFNFTVEVSSNSWPYWTDSLQVFVLPQFIVTPNPLQLGSVALGDTLLDSVVVYNNGNPDLIIASINTSNSFLSITPTTGTIAPGSSETFQVQFSANVAGPQQAFMVFNHNGPTSPDSLIVDAMVTGITNTEGKIPHLFALYQNYPNPFNPVTKIEFQIPNNDFVTLKIYNLLGEEVATLLSDQLLSGIHSIEWNSSDLASGVYIYQVKTGSYQAVKKMLLLK